jgi:hypothetical protein
MWKIILRASILRTACLAFTLGVVPALNTSAWAQAASAPVQGPQSSEVEQLRERMKTLEQTVEELKRERATSQGAESPVLPTSEQPPVSPGTSTTVPLHVRERPLLTHDHYSAPRPDNAPFDPQLRGFFAIPGSQTMLRIGGFARTDVIHDFEPAGNTAKFVTSSIPTGANPGNDNTNISIAPSRINIELRSNTSYGPLRIFYENDFLGGPNSTPTYRLRHFYGQWVNLLVGQTFTAWRDVDAIPDTVDFQGPTSVILRFNPQIRYTYQISSAHLVAASVEQPNTEIPGTITAPAGTVDIRATSPYPDFVLKYRYEHEAFHIQTAWLLRSLGGFAGASAEQQVFGWGGMISASAMVFGRDHIMFQANFGEGTARYIQDLGSGSGLDVGLTATGRLVALPAYGAYVAYQHFWAERWRSTATYGFFKVNTTDLAPTSTNPTPLYSSTQYAEANLMYSPGHGFTIGGAILWGQHTQKDGSLGDAFRLNFVLQYDLVHLENLVRGKKA